MMTIAITTISIIITTAQTSYLAIIMRMISISLSAQSIVHGDVLSEKINFSAYGSSNSAIFGPDYLDP